MPALHAGYVWDDSFYISDNLTLRSADGLRRIWFDPLATPQYYPVVFSTFWLEYRLWGAAPLGYHAVNVGLHAVNALLVWAILRRLAIPGAFFAAAVFALHPVHVESVAWVSERKDVLSGAFGLSTVLLWLRFTDARRWWQYAGAMLLFGGALLSKTMVCTLPAILLLLACWRRPQSWRREIAPLLPLLAMAAAAAALTVWRERAAMPEALQAWALPLGERLLMAGGALWFYAAKLIWPTPLMAIYPKWHVDLGSPWHYVPLIGAAAGIVPLWSYRRRLGLGPLVAVISFVLMLSPVLGVVSFGFMAHSYVADHLQYLPSIALIALGGVIAAAGSERVDRVVPQSDTFIGVLILLVLGTLTWRQTSLYESAEKYWRHNLAGNAMSSTVHTNLAVALAENGRQEEALHHYRSALRLNAGDVKAHNNLAVLLVQRGQLVEASTHLAAALRLQPSAPEAYNNLGDVLVRQGRLAEAIEHLQAALRLKPDYPEASNSLAVALIRAGRPTEALAHIETALRLRPDYALAHNSLGVVLALQGKLQQAVKEFSTAVRLKPDYEEAKRNLQIALAQQRAATGKATQGSR